VGSEADVATALGAFWERGLRTRVFFGDVSLLTVRLVFLTTFLGLAEPLVAELLKSDSSMVRFPKFSLKLGAWIIYEADSPDA
jgi:hypothetical protein